MTCKLCEAASHPPAETYAQVIVRNPMSGEEAIIDVCLEHYEVVEDAIREETSK
jgi:hypothetical protein